MGLPTEPDGIYIGLESPLRFYQRYRYTLTPDIKLDIS